MLSHASLAVMLARAGIQYATASRLKHSRLWNTGSPAEAGDDDPGAVRQRAVRHRAVLQSSRNSKRPASRWKLPRRRLTAAALAAPSVAAKAAKLGAQERTRTFTAVKPLAPEASASTNSATWACGGGYYGISRALVKLVMGCRNGYTENARCRIRTAQDCPRLPKLRLKETDAMASNQDTLVTIFGGSGFLGRNVVRALCRRDYRVQIGRAHV